MTICGQRVDFAGVMCMNDIGRSLKKFAEKITANTVALAGILVATACIVFVCAVMMTIQLC